MLGGTIGATTGKGDANKDDDACGGWPNEFALAQSPFVPVRVKVGIGTDPCGTGSGGVTLWIGTGNGVMRLAPDTTEREFFC